MVDLQTPAGTPVRISTVNPDATHHIRRDTRGARAIVRDQSDGMLAVEWPDGSRSWILPVLLEDA